MKKNTPLKLSRIMLIVNMLFWLFMAFYLSFSKYGAGSYLIIKILLFFESILYFISLIGIIKRLKLIYLGSLFLSFGNIVFSLTDQIGLLDIISLFLSLSAFLSLTSLWKLFFELKKENETAV